MTSKSSKPEISIRADIPATQAHAKLIELAAKLRHLERRAFDVELRERAAYLERLGLDIDTREFAADLERSYFCADIKELAAALERIGLGADAGEVLGTAGSRGSDPKKETAHFTKNLAVTWVLTAMAPVDEDGMGLKRKKAVVEAAKLFDFDVDTLSRYVTALGKTLVGEDVQFSMMALRPRRKKPAD